MNNARTVQQVYPVDLSTSLARLLAPDIHVINIT